LGRPAYQQDAAARARRAQRVTRLEAALRRGEAEAKADAEAERARRAAAAAERGRTGQTRRGPVPQPIEETPDDTAQRSWTAPALPSRRLPHPGGDACGNAPARGDGACPIIVACAGPDATPDKQPAAPLAQAPRATLAPAGMEQPKDAAGDVQVSPGDLGPWLCQ